MKLQTLALGLALAMAGSAFAATTRDITVTRDTPHGTVTKHIVKTNDDARHRNQHLRRVAILHPQHHHHHAKKVVIYHPARHGRHEDNRTVVIHHRT
jgi:hypothetical protein